MNSASILLGVLFGGLISGGLRDPLAAALFAAAVWLLGLKSSERLSWRDAAPWLPWLAWALVSGWAGAQPLKSLYPLSRWAGVVAFFALARGLWGEKERGLWFGALCACSGVLALAALWTGARGHFDETMTGLIPPYYNYTAFVEAAAAAAISAALSHPSGPRGRSRTALWILLAFLVSMLLLARARGALLAALLGGALSLIRQGGARRLAAFALAPLVAFAALAVVLAAFRGLSSDYFLKRDKDFRRPQIWRAAAQAACDHPFLGEGPGNFELGFLRRNFPSRHGYANYNFSTPYAHSEPLQIAVETGWAGLALFILALALSLRAPRAAGSFPEEAALAASIAMGAHLLVDNMLQLQGLAFLFFSALAVARGGEPAQPAGPPAGGRLVAAGALGLALTAWLPGFLVESYTARAQKEEDPGARLSLARRAAALYPAEAALREELARAWLAQIPPRPDEALMEFAAASRLSPNNAIYPVLGAELLRVPGDWPGVMRLAEEGLRLEPAYLLARLQRAEALARSGRKAQARAELEEVLRRRKAIESLRPALGRGSGYDETVIRFDAERFALVRRLAR